MCTPQNYSDERDAPKCRVSSVDGANGSHLATGSWEHRPLPLPSPPAGGGTPKAAHKAQKRRVNGSSIRRWGRGVCWSASTCWQEGRMNHKVVRLLLLERNGLCLSRGPERGYWEKVSINSGRLNSNSGPAAGFTSPPSTSFSPTLPPSFHHT